MGLNLTAAIPNMTALMAAIGAAQTTAAQANTTATSAAQAATTAQQTVAGQQQAITDLTTLANTVTSLSNASTTDRAAIHTQLDVVAAQVADLIAHAPGFATQATTALTLAATKDYTVTLSRTMPTGYKTAVLVDPAFAGKLGATVTANTPTTVTVRTTGLVAVGAASFTVIAWN